MHNDIVWQGHLRAHFALGVMRHHDLHLDPEHALAHVDVANGFIDVVQLGLTGRDEVAILELHGLGSLSSQLAADDDFTALGTVLHNEADDTIACPTNCKAAQELVAQRLSLCHGTACAVLDALCEQLHAVLREAVALLDHCSQFSDSASLVAKHLSSACGTNDDLRSDWCDTHLHTCVSILGQCAHEELIQLCVEDTICDKFAFLGHLNLRHGGRR
mmetsp:Transcript_31932/g.72857  ORF Transcript_31932/g.72857 Transcript_31932/m.72857 type:complete len:217 (+) Transcript_31932:292-942(+)